MIEGRYTLPVRDADNDGYTPYSASDSVVQAKQTTLRYLRNVGAMVAGRADVEVKIVPKGKVIGFTNGKVIFIRNGDFTDPEYLKLINGLIDHEAGHIKHSDFEYLKSLSLTPLELAFFKPIEDVRMEQCVKNEFPGAALNLQGMCEVLVARGGADYHTQPFPVRMQGYVMLYCRYHFNQDECMHVPMLVTRNALVEVLNESFVSRVDKVLAQVEKVTEMSQVKPVVDELIHLLEEQRDQTDDSDEQGNEQSQKSNQEVSKNKGSGKASPVPASDSASQRLPKDKNESSSQTAGENLSQESQTQVTPSQAAREILSAGEQALNADLHDQARGLMESMADEAHQGNKVDHFLTDRRYIVNPPIDRAYFDVERSQVLFRQLAPLVKKAFFSMLPKPGEYRSRGNQIAPERFAHALAGRGSVFKDEPIRRQSVANVHIAVDCSESMAGVGEPSTSPMMAANNAVFALATALYQLPKVNVQVDYFSSYTDVLFYRACPFGKPPLSDAFGLKPSGSTPTPSAIKEATYELCRKHNRPGARNYFILIADGDPHGDQPLAGGENIKRMLEMARATGIRVFCIVIAHEKQQGMYYRAGFKPHECVFIQSADQLVNAFDQVVRDGIFTQ